MAQQQRGIRPPESERFWWAVLHLGMVFVGTGFGSAIYIQFFIQ